MVSDAGGEIVLVPTPIGNLGDITLRALECLKRPDHIVAEDTRHTRKLLSHLEIDAGKLSRLDANASIEKIARVLSWVEQGECVAMVSDAGAPGISDPGAQVVREAIARNLVVRALPGASAVTVAVSVSGLVDKAFRFIGFLSRTNPKRGQEKLPRLG